MAPAGAGAPRVGLRRVTRFNSNFAPVSVWPVMVSAVANGLVHLLDDDLVAVEPGVGGRCRIGAGGFLDDGLAVPAVAGQPAGKEHRAKRAMAQRADLGAKLGAGTGIFALELEIRVGVLRVGIDFHFRRFYRRCRRGQSTGREQSDHSAEKFHALILEPMCPATKTDPQLSENGAIPSL